MLKVGQRLWYKNKENHRVGYIIVEQVDDDKFYFVMEGKRYCLSCDVIGKRLYCSLFDIPIMQDNVPKDQRVQQPKRHEVRQRKSGIQKRTSEVQLEDTPPAVIMDSPPHRTPSCEICALRKNGTCGSLSNLLCEDYKPTQYLSKEELDSFPKYGLATEIRIRGKK